MPLVNLNSEFLSIVNQNAELLLYKRSGALLTVPISDKSQVNSSQGSFLVGSEEWFQILFLEVTTSKSGAVNHHLNQPQFREKSAILENF